MRSFRTMRGLALTWAISISSGFSFLLFGYDNGVMAGLITMEPFLSAMGHPDSGTLGTIVAIYNLGCFGGCIIASFFGFKLGRRRAIMLGCWINILGTIIQTAAFGIAQLIVGRIVCGVATGLITSSIPTWVSETSSASQRGGLVAAQLAIVSLGIFIANAINFGLHYVTWNEAAWRFPIAFQCFWAFLTLATIHFLPESPRWLYASGRHEEADEVLARLKDAPFEATEVQSERAEILGAIELEKSHPKMTFRDVLWDKSDLKIMRRIITSFACQWWQQFAGISIVIGYLPLVIVNLLHLSETLSLGLGLVSAVVYTIASCPPIWFVDRVGRRKGLMFGSLAMALCWAAFVGLVTQTQSNACLYAAVVMIYLFQIAFAFSWLSIPWIYPSEITPLSVRHIGAAVGTSAEWLSAFLIAEVTPVALETIGWRFFLVFVVMNLAAIPLVYFFFPETAGLSLEAIDLLYVTGRLTGGIEEQREQAALRHEELEKRAQSAGHVEEVATKESDTGSYST